MKKYILIVILLFLSPQLLAQKQALYPAQKDVAFDSGSKIDDKMLAVLKTDDLKTLGLIWGFLKYYHPNVIAGKYNWDYELFRIIPKLAKTKNTSERDKTLTAWINSLGTFKQGKNKGEKGEVKIKADLDWISKSKFSKELSAALMKVVYAKRSGPQFYVAQAENGKPEFLHENGYIEMKYPDAGFRLLSLYRYWNCIQYFYAYKNGIKEDWKNVLVEFIPKFAKASDQLAYKLAALEIITRINDTQASILNQHRVIAEYKGNNLPPLQISFIENKAVVTGFYNETGKASRLEIGDYISHINDKPIDQIVKPRLKYIPASNPAVKLRDAARELLRTNDPELNVTFVRKGVLDYKKLKTVPYNQIKTERIFSSGDTCFKYISPKIAYLYLGSIKQQYLPKIMKEIENTDGLIIDLRCYPSEFVTYSLAEYLKPEKTPFAKFSVMNLTTPGNFTISETVSSGGGNVNHYKGSVVILVNEVTQSQAEFTAMSFRTAPNATVIGSTTAGADGEVTELVLPAGINTMISGLGISHPDGSETPRMGIVPGIEVRPTVAGIREKRDEVLEKAVEFINTKSE